MKILDLYCGAGGASMGYALEGHEVVGVDLHPQPHYPFEFHQGDALTYPLDGFDFIHASPPCQRFSRMSGSRPGLNREYPDLIETTRQRLITSGLPWVIENVVGAPLLDPITLCGWSLGLQLYRHRLFETNFNIIQPVHFAHKLPASKAGHWEPGTIISVAGHCAPMDMAREAMGIHWMNRAELVEAIPPAMARYIIREWAQLH